jgi:HAMP domain-containing protein
LFNTLAAAGTEFDFKAIWESITQSFKDFGITKTLFALFFFWAHWYVRQLYLRNLKDKQGEIDRMAQNLKEMRDENKELRDELRDTFRKLGSKPK